MAHRVNYILCIFPRVFYAYLNTQSIFVFHNFVFFKFLHSSTHFHPVYLEIYKHTKVSLFCLQLNNFPLEEAVILM